MISYRVRDYAFRGRNAPAATVGQRVVTIPILDRLYVKLGIFIAIN